MEFTELFSLRIADAGDVPIIARLIGALTTEQGAAVPPEEQLQEVLQALIQTRFSDFDMSAA